MKKLVVLVLMVAALLGITIHAEAIQPMEYITNFEEPEGVAWLERQNAIEIKAGVAYKQALPFQKEQIFRFCPEKDGMYKLSFACEEANWGGGRASIIDSTGNTVGSECVLPNKNQVIVNLKKNNIYYIQLYTNQAVPVDYMFAICTEGIHPQNNIYNEVSLPSCTEPGIQQSICQFCDTVADERESAPAKGHVPGEWKTTREPTCAAEGTRAQLCTVCGEVAARETLPKKAHTPGEMKEDQAPTCTEPGT